MFLSGEIDIKLCQSYTKTYICIRFSKIISVLNRSYSANTQSENDDFPEKPEKLRFAPIII